MKTLLLSAALALGVAMSAAPASAVVLVHRVTHVTVVHPVRRGIVVFHPHRVFPRRVVPVVVVKHPMVRGIPAVVVH